MILLLAAMWLVFSGHYKPLFLGFGVFSVALVVWLSGRMAVIHPESHPFRYLGRLIAYWGWLIPQIVRANLDVARRVLGPESAISPRVVEAPASQRNDMDRVVHANSITLTPGTVSMEVHPDRIEVHALTRESAAAVMDGVIDRRVPDTGERH